MERTIIDCTIVEDRWMNYVSVVFLDGSEDEKFIIYYPDEIQFTADEFIGLTETEARELFHQRDQEYLRS